MTDSQREQAQLDTLFDVSPTCLSISHPNPDSPNRPEC